MVAGKGFAASRQFAGDLVFADDDLGQWLQVRWKVGKLSIFQEQSADQHSDSLEQAVLAH